MCRSALPECLFHEIAPPIPKGRFCIGWRPSKTPIASLLSMRAGLPSRGPFGAYWAGGICASLVRTGQENAGGMAERQAAAHGWDVSC